MRFAKSPDIRSKSPSFPEAREIQNLVCGQSVRCLNLRYFKKAANYLQLLIVCGLTVCYLKKRRETTWN